MKLLFTIAAIYELVLGLVFLFFPLNVFSFFEVTPPNHLAYVQFPALLLVMFGIMFYQISLDPSERKFFIPYGIGLKISYCLVVAYYMLVSTIPTMWVPWAIADAVFIFFFYSAWKKL